LYHSLQYENNELQPVTGIIYFSIKVYLFCAMIILIYSLLADGIMNEEGYNYLFDYSYTSVVNTINIVTVASYTLGY